MIENELKINVVNHTIKDKDALRNVRPIFIWMIVGFALLIIMCVWDVYLLVPVLGIEFLCIIPIAVKCRKNFLRLQREAQYPEETIFTARDGELYKGDMRVNVTYNEDLGEIYLDDMRQVHGVVGSVMTYFVIVTGETLYELVQFCRYNGVTIHDEAGNPTDPVV